MNVNVRKGAWRATYFHDCLKEYKPFLSEGEAREACACSVGSVEL
jgi:hypothetical protein